MSRKIKKKEFEFTHAKMKTTTTTTKKTCHSNLIDRLHLEMSKQKGISQKLYIYLSFPLNMFCLLTLEKVEESLAVCGR